MKKIAAVFFVFVLAACIDVDDFGALWNKADMDPRFAGQWQRTWPAFDTEKEDPFEVAIFTKKEDGYEVLDRGTAYEGDPVKPVTKEETIYPVRTLDIGAYHFLITADSKLKGQMIRYDLTPEGFVAYTANDRTVCPWLAKNYPTARNIHYADEESVQSPCGIGVLDPETVKIIASIPNNDAFWDIWMKFKKTRP